MSTFEAGIGTVVGYGLRKKPILLEAGRGILGYHGYTLAAAVLGISVGTLIGGAWTGIHKAVRG